MWRYSLTRSRSFIFLDRPLCSADGGSPVDGDEGLITVKSSSDTSSSGSGEPWVEVVVPVALAREHIFAHAI